MKIRDDLYLMHQPDYHVTIEDAMKLIHFLSTDIASDAPKIHWSYHPSETTQTFSSAQVSIKARNALSSKSTSIRMVWI